MNQLDYQQQPTAFAPGSFFHNQALPQASYPGQQQGQQSFQGQQQSPHHQAQQRPHAQDGMYTQPTGQFTTTSYSQAISAGTAAQQQAALRQSASPNQANSPYQQQIKYPMAAPPLPHTPQQYSISTPTTPQSPDGNVEQARIKLLFEINVDLIQEISNLQAQDKGGATSPQQQVQLKQQNMSDKMASDEYIQTMRRVQANLAYLAPRGNLSTSSQKPVLGPAHMTPPAQMPQLQAKYDKLKELFPGWTGMDLGGQQAQYTGRAGNMNGTMA